MTVIRRAIWKTVMRRCWGCWLWMPLDEANAGCVEQSSLPSLPPCVLLIPFSLLSCHSSRRSHCPFLAGLNVPVAGFFCTIGSSVALFCIYLPHLTVSPMRARIISMKCFCCHFIIGAWHVVGPQALHRITDQYFKRCKVTNNEILRNYHRLEETKKTWQVNTFLDPRLDPETEKECYWTN